MFFRTSQILYRRVEKIKVFDSNWVLTNYI